MIADSAQDSRDWDTIAIYGVLLAIAVIFVGCLWYFQSDYWAEPLDLDDVTLLAIARGQEPVPTRLVRLPLGPAENQLFGLRGRFGTVAVREHVLVVGQGGEDGPILIGKLKKLPDDLDSAFCGDPRFVTNLGVPDLELATNPDQVLEQRRAAWKAKRLPIYLHTMPQQSPFSALSIFLFTLPTAAGLFAAVKLFGRLQSTRPSCKRPTDPA